MKRDSDLDESAWSHLSDRPRLREPVNRHTMAVALITAPVIFGSLAIATLGPDRDTLLAIGAIVAGCGAVAGWIHPRVRQLRRRTAAAGFVRRDRRAGRDVSVHAVARR